MSTANTKVVHRPAWASVQRTLLLALLAVLVVDTNAAAQAKPSAPEIDRSGHGAVLCTWRLMVAANAAANSCPASRDPRTSAALSTAIRRTDKFIIKNSATTKDQLQQQKVMIKRELGAQRACVSGADELYSHFKAAGSEAIRREIDDLLSAPRKPLLNPCV